MLLIHSDIRLAARKLGAAPGLVLTVVAALGFGLGINTAVFTLVHAVLIRGLPFPDADRMLYVLTQRPDRDQRFGISLPEFRDYREQSRIFEALAAHRDSEFNLSDPQQPPERYRGAYITANAFSITSVRPMIGRDFNSGDEHPGAPAVVLLGHRIWRNRYGEDRSITGKTIRVNGEPLTVIGVMPPDFRFPTAHDLWLPLRTTADLEKRTNRGLGVYGLIRPERTLADARAEANVISQRVKAAWPKEREGMEFLVRTFNEQFNGGNIRAVFLLMLGAVGFVVLIVCANVTNLLLARSMHRHREMALRLALGATRGRIIRELLTESLLLGLGGGLVGLAVAWVGVKAFSAAVENVGKPYWIEFRFEPAVFAWLALLCVGSAIVFGLAPALRLSRVDLHSALKEGERGSGGSIRTRWFTAAMVASQIGLAVVLLVGAGLLVTSFLRASNLGAGLDGSRWLSGRVQLREAGFEEPAARVRLVDRVLERVRSIPGVEAASVTTNLPLFGASGWRFQVEGQAHAEDDQWPAADGITITEGYFDAVGKRLLRGRDIEPLDGSPGRQVVVVNETFARRYFPGEDPIGKRIRLQLDDRPWLSIVGVAPDIRTSAQERPDRQGVVYLPYRQSPGRFWQILLRAAPAAQDGVAKALRAEMQAIAPDLPVADVRPYAEDLRRSNWPFQVFGTIFAIFAGFALLLATVGLYAVISYFVNQRSREIGIRMALGATRGTIARWALRGGLVPLVVGLVFGIGGGVAVGRVMASSRLLVGTGGFDPAAFAAVIALLLASGLLASWIPARRAARVDPLVALRYE